MLEKTGAGIKISQPDSETIKVIESGGAARVFGVIIWLVGTLLIWNSGGKIMDLTLIFGFLLMLFGAAVATQRYVMTLDRLHGTWSYGGDVFFAILFKNRGSLFGKHWSIEEAKNISSILAEFIDKPVLDGSNKN